MWVASATMPDLDSEQQGHSARLLRALIWAGVGLAPVAAVVVLVGGSDGSVRFGVLLIAVCVVLIGASMLIRSDPVLLRMHVEDRVAEEIDSLREKLRDEFHEEIAGTARATGHRIQAMQEELAQARGHMGANVGAVVPVGAAPASVGAASVRAGSVGAAAVGAASAGAGGVAAVGTGSVGAASVGMGSVGAASVGMGSVGAASVGVARSEPGLGTGGRAVGVGAASVPGGGRAAGAAGVRPAGAAVVGQGTVGQASTAVAPRQPGIVSGPVRVPGVVSGAVPPQPTPAFRPPAGGPQGRAGGSYGPGPHIPDQGWQSSGSMPPGPPTTPGVGDGYGREEPGYGSRSNLGHGQGSRSDLPHGRGPDPRSDAPGVDPAGDLPSGKRRADVTAIDLGYTGRRSRANHASTEDNDQNPGGFSERAAEPYGAAGSNSYGEPAGSLQAEATGGGGAGAGAGAGGTSYGMPSPVGGGSKSFGQPPGSSYGRPPAAEGGTSYGRPPATESGTSYGQSATAGSGGNSYGRPPALDGVSGYNQTGTADQPRAADGGNNYGRPATADNAGSRGDNGFDRRPAAGTRNAEDLGYPAEENTGNDPFDNWANGRW